MKQYLYLIIFLLAASACNEADYEMNHALPGPDNLNTVLGRKKATVSWEYKRDDVQYFIINLARDEKFAPTLLTDTISAEVREYTFEDLGSLERYFVRIQTRTTDRMTNPQPVIYSFRSAEIENILIQPNIDDIGSETVLLSWNQPVEGTVTHIVLTPAGGSALPQVNLTSEQVAARTAELTDLEPSTNYTAEIFDGAETRGISNFKTKDRGAAITINDDDVEYATLADAIAAATSGDVINITTGTYDYAGQTLAIVGKSLTFQAKTDSDVPVIVLQNFALSGDIGLLKFLGITIQSAIKSGATDYEKHIFGATYVTGTLDLILEKCDLSGAESGIFFTQTVGAGSAPSPVPGTGSFSLTVDNCLLHDFGNAGGDFIDFRSGSIDKAVVKNSTFWKGAHTDAKGARAFFRIDAGVSASASSIIGIENSTLYDFCNGGAFVRFQAAGVEALISKCVLVNKISTHNNSLTNGAKATFDQNNLFGSNIANMKSGGVVNTNETQLDPSFANAAAGNFTLGNATLKAAEVGDPRWW